MSDMDVAGFQKCYGLITAVWSCCPPFWIETSIELCYANVKIACCMWKANNFISQFSGHEESYPKTTPEEFNIHLERRKL